MSMLPPFGRRWLCQRCQWHMFFAISGLSCAYLMKVRRQYIEFPMVIFLYQCKVVNWWFCCILFGKPLIWYILHRLRTSWRKCEPWEERFTGARWTMVAATRWETSEVHVFRSWCLGCHTHKWMGDLQVIVNIMVFLSCTLSSHIPS